MPPDVTCKQLIDFLDDYVAHRLQPDVLANFEAHLTLCPPCREYVRTYSDTTKLARPCCCEGKPPPLPDDLVKAIIESARGSSRS